MKELLIDIIVMIICFPKEFKFLKRKIYNRCNFLKFSKIYRPMIEFSCFLLMPFGELGRNMSNSLKEGYDFTLKQYIIKQLKIMKEKELILSKETTVIFKRFLGNDLFNEYYKREDINE